MDDKSLYTRNALAGKCPQQLWMFPVVLGQNQINLFYVKSSRCTGTSDRSLDSSPTWLKGHANGDDCYDLLCPRSDLAACNSISLLTISVHMKLP